MPDIFSGYWSAIRELSQHVSEEDQAGGEEGNGVGDGREVCSPLLVRILYWQWRVSPSGEKLFL